MGKSISMDASEDDWQAKSDMRTLAEAEEIRKDPKRFKAAMEKAREKLAEIESLLDSDKK
jgi:PHD/YefM family antitoxin component YafN of YafNO toxin-antitoxin module